MDSGISPPNPPPTLVPKPKSNSPQSSLYLFTFLTTILLLLAISLCIILRSILVRRRYMRQLRPAIEAGWLSSDGLTPNYGEEPIMHHIWLRRWSEGGSSEKIVAGDDEKAYDSWGGITPVSAAIVHRTEPPRSSAHPSSDDHPSSPSRLRKAATWFGLADPPSVTPPAPPFRGPSPAPPCNQGASRDSLNSDETLDETREEQSSDVLVMTVMIAMPSPHNPRYLPQATPTNPAVSRHRPSSSVSSSFSTSTTSTQCDKGKRNRYSYMINDQVQPSAEVLFGVTEMQCDRSLF